MAVLCTTETSVTVRGLRPLSAYSARLSAGGTEEAAGSSGEHRRSEKEMHTDAVNFEVRWEGAKAS